MFKSIKVAAGPIKDAPLVAGMFADDLEADGEKRRRPGKRSAASRNQPTPRFADAPGFKAETGETFVTSTGDVLLGMGKSAELSGDVLRTIGARLLKRLDRMASTRINLMLSEDVESGSSNMTAQTTGRCIGEGIGLANWRVDFFAGKASKHKPMNAELALGSPDPDFRQGLQQGLELAEHANFARRIGATPPNICNPSWMADEARKLARQTGLKCTIIDYSQAKRRGMGGITAVGMGSNAKPNLIILEHKPQRLAPSAKNIRLALVGKAITYDTGGYSLKINNTMKGMKYDKSGGAAVFAAMRAVARMKLPVHVVGILACAENMVSRDAYRPDDIITMYNGVSVEVTNTDAEGRLVLADALSYACKDMKATHIVDLATLTGGIVVALGHFCAGVFCNDDHLLERINQAAELSGEKVWRMPLWKDHKEFMRAQHADILNSNPARSAHPVQGAAFLAYFVDGKIPWAHIDIAGVSNTEKDTDLFVTGPTGYGVRLLLDLVQGFAASTQQVVNPYQPEALARARQLL